MSGELVRDFVPELMQDDGRDPIIEEVDGEEYVLLLWDMLHATVEKLGVQDVDTPAAAMLDDIVDLLEVVYTIAAVHGWDDTAIDARRDEKAQTHGRFGRGLVWMGDR